MKLNRLILMLLFLEATNLALCETIQNISRLQVRFSDQDTQTIDQSTFLQFPNKFYILEQYQKNFPANSPPWSLNFNLGGNIPGLGKLSSKNIFDWAVRSQKYEGFNTVASAGLQINFTNAMNSPRVQSFLQIFPIKTSNLLGSFDILHYYNIHISQNFSIRGYNQYIINIQHENLFYPFADFIYSVNKNFDLYTRASYLTGNTTFFGQKGLTLWLGCRFNLQI